MEEKLFEIVTKLLNENGMKCDQHFLSLSLSLHNHLGLDSISRAELLRRIENEFNVRFSKDVLRNAETLQDIADALLVKNQDLLAISKVPIANPIKETNTDSSGAMTLNEVLMLHVASTPNRPHIYLQTEENTEITITYENLFLEAQKIARNLIKKGLNKSDTVAIMLPTCADFFYCFMGILLAGGIPVPIYPPARIDQIENYIKKEAKILSNAHISFLITFDKAKLLSRLLKSFVPSLKVVITADLLRKKNNSILENNNINADDIALIQHTSGSTNHPKGVVLTHQNILANIRSYGEAIRITSADVCISWLPLYHDLGLIGNWLGSLYFGVPLVVFSPLDFLSRPEKWLWAIHHYRGTISAAPNFGYELCVSKLPANLLEGLDLSSWRIAVNGAETVHPGTLDRFIQKFSQYGFKKETMLPVYGLAENALGLTTTPLNRGVRVDIVQRSAFESAQKAIPCQTNDKIHCLQFVSCGKVMPHHKIRIVNEKNQPLAEREVGELQFQGPSNMRGYFNNIKATHDFFNDGWCNTGDLGYIADSELYITGRKKDVIIKAGRNFIPADIEYVVAEVPGIRRGCVIAFSINDASKGTEQLIIVAETAKVSLESMEQTINAKIYADLGVIADHIVLVPPRTIPKTSSGKLQRAACKALYLENKLRNKSLSFYSQVLKIGTQFSLNKAKAFINLLAQFFYTIYIDLWVLITLPIIWSVILLSSEKKAMKRIRQWFRFIFFISFCPISVSGKENLEKTTPQIFVANHGSYLDSVFLISILPENVCLVGKKSLLKVPILKTFIKKLGYISIDKQDRLQALDDIEIVKERLRLGQSVLLFPEGTFGYAEGLRPFRLGAFKLAVDTQFPICPIAISGTRYALRGNSKLFKWHPLKAVVSEPIFPKGNEWNDINALKQQAYTIILEHGSEPRLDYVVMQESVSKKKVANVANR